MRCFSGLFSPWIWSDIFMSMVGHSDPPPSNASPRRRVLIRMGLTEPRGVRKGNGLRPPPAWVARGLVGGSVQKAGWRGLFTVRAESFEGSKSSHGFLSCIQELERRPARSGARVQFPSLLQMPAPRDLKSLCVTLAHDTT